MKKLFAIAGIVLTLAALSSVDARTRPPLFPIFDDPVPVSPL